MLVGIDNNVVSVLARGDRPGLHSLLVAALDQGLVRVCLTHPLVRETCLTAVDAQLYAKHVAFLRATCREVLLRDYNERVPYEVRNRCPMPEHEVLVTSPESEPVFDGLDDRAAALAWATTFQQTTEEHAAAERAQGRGLVTWLRDNGHDRNQVRSVLQRYFGSPRMAVTQWVRSTVARCSRQLGVDRDLRPTRHTVPTIWYTTSYHIGRIRLIETSQKIAERQDVADWGHAGEVGYLDRFVTDDRPFHRIVEWAPVPTWKFITMDEFEALLRRLVNA